MSSTTPSGPLVTASGGDPEQLRSIQRGIERECLRITGEGRLAQTPHPTGLGSALTHPSITTDYSEALLEFITPIHTGIDSCLEQLADVHSFVYSQLDEEQLWSASMPCVMRGEEHIPVAEYGSSHVAQMKTVYRLGLGHRYGRLMQTIAGIHYNFSMPDAWWRERYAAAHSKLDFADYVTERYLGLIRNFNRHSWLLVYLFGASPAVCASFLKGRDDHGLQPFDEEGRSYHLPYATALRMGGLGYQSDAQNDLRACYNALPTYIATLKEAILEPHPAYTEIGVRDGDNWKQLSDSLLQIENEFYSPIRPKRVARSGETALDALQRGGIEYIEVRCTDVSPFSPLGIDAQHIRFLDTFLLYCLLSDSPPCTDAEQDTSAANLEAIVTRGREPGLLLQSPAGERPMKAVAAQLLAGMDELAALLDTVWESSDYSAALTEQRAKVDDPERTPSARVLAEMRDQDVPFFRLAMNYSERWAEHFRKRTLCAEKQAALVTESLDSLDRQTQVEAADTGSFESYLEHYFDQYRSL